MNKYLMAIYLDWLNNYLTLEKMAQDYGLKRKTLAIILDEARTIYNATNTNEVTK